MLAVAHTVTDRSSMSIALETSNNSQVLNGIVVVLDGSGKVLLKDHANVCCLYEIIQVLAESGSLVSG